MPNVTCQYHDCFNTNATKSMFSFPINDEGRLGLWIKHSGNIQLASLTRNVLKNRYICQDHFETKDVMKLKARCILVPTAVPLNHKPEHQEPQQPNTIVNIVDDDEEENSETEEVDNDVGVDIDEEEKDSDVEVDSDEEEKDSDVEVDSDEEEKDSDVEEKDSDVKVDSDEEQGQQEEAEVYASHAKLGDKHTPKCQDPLNLNIVKKEEEEESQETKADSTLTNASRQMDDHDMPIYDASRSRPLGSMDLSPAKPNTVEEDEELNMADTEIDDAANCKKLNKAIQNMKLLLKNLQSENIRLQIEARKLISFQSLKSEASKTLVKMQLKKKRGGWTEEEKLFCLSLFKKSMAAYDHLREQGVVLASRNQIYEWLRRPTRADSYPGQLI